MTQYSQNNHDLTTGYNGTIDMILTNYARALDCFDEISRQLELAEQCGKLAGCNHFMSGVRYGLKRSEEEKRIRSDAWRYLLDQTGIVTLMDSKTHKKMNDDLENNPPALTRKTIKDVLIDLFKRRDAILADSLINVFLSLSRHYKSNDKIKLTGKRVIIYIGAGLWRTTENTDKLTDLERILRYLDGQPAPSERQETLGYRVAYKAKDTDEIETDYLRVVLFKNGNAHIYFKRPDLIDQCNKLIAYHHENRLGHDNQTRH